MAFYSLLIVDKQETVGGIAARDRAEAVAMFGRQLGRDLTLVDDDTCVAQYRLDEWWEGPHFLNHTIPVFAKQP
ncbi:MAG: hypothetical protein WAN51_07720 [Alphaproteobacteria bacterium]